MQISGWYDLFLAGTLDNFQRLRSSYSALEQRLVIGPWAHGNFGETLGDSEFGPYASLSALDPTRMHLEFFKALLADDSPPEAPVRLFVMGSNQWCSESDWPLSRASERRLYLHSRGNANSVHGDGLLAAESPLGAQPADQYVYDPRIPVPTCGGASLLPGLATGASVGPRDQSDLEQRDDVLVFTTDVLADDWEVTGYVTVSLYASTTALDTDWTAKLVDVNPDGRPLGVCDGIVRARYRHRGKAALLLPGEVELYEIALGAISMLFRSGHRIRLEIASSNFPRFDRNPNTGGVIAATPYSELQIAHQSIFHDIDHQSFLALPVVTAV